MNGDKNQIIFRSFSSYEEFQENISEESNLEQVKKFLSFFQKETITEKLKHFKRVKQLGFGRANFYLNLLCLYRWLLTDGFRTFNIDVIDTFFTFLNKLVLPWFVIGRMKWGYPLTNREGFNTNEEFWEKKVLNRFVEKFDIRSRFSEVIDLWLLYHIGLRQLFVGKTMSATMETVLTNYMNLVNKYNELEEIFGVAIERDLYRVYEFFRGKNE